MKTGKSNIWDQLYQQGLLVSSTLDNAQALTPRQLNADLDMPAVVNVFTADWLPSPAKGVMRLLLDRDGGEKTTRATSLVAYVPNSHFSAHEHPLGEEFLVLSGVFSDEEGDYPAGTYVRNPPLSSHQPFSQQGCLILVKLQQFLPDDRGHVVQSVDLFLDNVGESMSDDASQSSWRQHILFDGYERVFIAQNDVEETLPLDWFVDGCEVLVLAGSLIQQSQRYDAGHWLRLPPDAAGKHLWRASAGTCLWVKTGHL